MMANGEKASMELIIDFARGMGVDPNPLLRAADYPEITATIPQVPASWLHLYAADLIDQGYEEYIQIAWAHWMRSATESVIADEPPLDLAEFLTDETKEDDLEWNSIRAGLVDLLNATLRYMNTRIDGRGESRVGPSTPEASGIASVCVAMFKVIRLGILGYRSRHHAACLEPYMAVRAFRLYYFDGGRDDTIVHADEQLRHDVINHTVKIVRDIIARYKIRDISSFLKKLEEDILLDHPHYSSRLLGLAVNGIYRLSFEDLMGHALTAPTTSYILNWMWELEIWYGAKLAPDVENQNNKRAPIERFDDVGRFGLALPDGRHDGEYTSAVLWWYDNCGLEQSELSIAWEEDIESAFDEAPSTQVAEVMKRWANAQRVYIEDLERGDLTVQIIDDRYGHLLDRIFHYYIDRQTLQRRKNDEDGSISMGDLHGSEYLKDLQDEFESEDLRLRRELYECHREANLLNMEMMKHYMDSLAN